MKTLNMLAIAIAVVAVSFAAIFARLANAPALSIAALRMLFASLILTPFVLEDKKIVSELKALSILELFILIVSGIFLAMHFALWIESLFFTTVASSVVFVATNPLFVALYLLIVKGERVPAAFWIGLSIAIAGIVILGGGDLSLGGKSWKGDLLAILGAIAVAGYFLVGSRLRRKLSLLSYIYPVYVCSSIFLFGASAILGRELFALSSRAYIYIFLMALVCQVVGHSLLNWSLRSVKPTIVTVAVLGEPVGSSLLAFLILHEAPRGISIVGGAIILLGIFVSISRYPGIFNEQA